MKKKHLHFTIYTLVVSLIISVIYFHNSTIIYGNSIPKYFVIIIGTVLISIIGLYSSTLDYSSLKIDFIEVLLILFLIWNFISINRFIALIETEILFDFSLVILVITLRRCISKTNVEKSVLLFGFFAILAFLGSLQAFYGLGQFAIYNIFDFFNAGIGKSGDLISGSFGPQNGYGNFITLSIIAVIYIISENREIVKKPILVSSSIAILIAFIVCQSRGAWLSFTITSIVLILLQYRKTLFENKITLKLSRKFSNKILSAGVAMIIFGVLSFIFYTVIFKMDFESTTGRIYIWQISWDMFTDNIITGVGYGDFGNEFLKYQTEFLSKPENSHFIQKATKIGNSHNQLLFHFCETGIIGGMIFISLCGTILSNLYRRIKNTVKYNKSYIFLLGFFLIMLMHSMVDTMLLVIPLKLLFFLGIAFVPSKSYEIIPSNNNMKILKYIGLFAFIIYGIFVFNKLYTEYPGYKYWAKGVSYMRDAEYRKAISQYKKGLEHLPDSPGLKANLGRSFIGNKQNKKGIDILNGINDKYQNRDTQLALSLGNLKIGNIKKAEQYAQKAHSMFPDQLRPKLLLGEIYYLKGDTSNSRSCFKKVIHESTQVKSAITEDLSQRSSEIYKRIFETKSDKFKHPIYKDSSIQSYIDSVMIAH